uniref:Male-enhanced antigen 1 n=1 Tax=Dicentrarchus labrax TaxID=13489 RepID=A0A8P4K356_DICLA
MEVWSSAMGPERVLPNSEDELGEDERPADGALLPAWSGGEGGGGGGGDGEEEGNSGGYYYQPLNQDPDGVNGGEDRGEEGEERGEEEAPSHTEQLQQVQHRIEVMGLHLPEAPPPDSDEDEDSEGAAAVRSRASIPMDADHVELVKRTMAAVALPSLGVPSWAREISDDQWKDMVENTLQSRQSAAALRLPRRKNHN